MKEWGIKWNLLLFTDEGEGCTKYVKSLVLILMKQWGSQWNLLVFTDEGGGV